MQDLSFNKGDFLPVKGTMGQAWNLAEINNQLLLGHHDGAFEITENNATSISSEPGFWNFVHFCISCFKIVAGNYKGLRTFDFINGRFPNQNSADFVESCRFVAIKFDNTWFHTIMVFIKF
jgi:hypothetical protein